MGPSSGRLPCLRPATTATAFVKGLLEAGTVTPIIDRTYALRDTSRAIAYVEAGHARGKVVITI